MFRGLGGVVLRVQRVTVRRVRVVRTLLVIAVLMVLGC